MEIYEKVILFFFRILKSITTRSFKLGQLIKDDEKINWWKFMKKLFIYFFRILKSITARSFKLGQLIEDDD